MAEKLSETMQAAYASATGELTLGDLLAKVESRSFGFLYVLIALPACIPGKPPGGAIPMGILLIPLAIQELMGRTTPLLMPWALKRRVVKGGKVGKVWAAIPKVIGWFERFLKPRKSHWYQGTRLRLLAGAVLLGAIGLLVPLPVTPEICGLGIVLVGLGALEEDGWFGIIGGIWAALSLPFAVGLAVAFFKYGVDLFHFIRH
jgi:hypothetical protein